MRSVALGGLVALSLASGRVSAQGRGGEDQQIGSCGIGGGMPLSTRASATYALSIEHDSLYISGIAVVRAQPGWRGSGGTHQPLVRPTRSGASQFLSGATIDTLFLEFDVDARVAWVHALKVPLDTNNVVLVDRVDSEGGPPVVSGIYRIPTPIPFRGSCGDKNFLETLFAAVEKALKSNTAIATFIGN
jgi:hypothetical protein